MKCKNFTSVVEGRQCTSKCFVYDAHGISGIIVRFKCGNEAEFDLNEIRYPEPNEFITC